MNSFKGHIVGDARGPPTVCLFPVLNRPTGSSDLLKNVESRSLTSDSIKDKDQTEKRNSKETDHTGCRRNLNKTTAQKIIREIRGKITRHKQDAPQRGSI